MSTQLNAIWSRTLEAVSSQVYHAAYETWLQHTAPLAIRNDHLIVRVPDELTRDIIQQRYLSLLEETVSELLQSPTSIELVLADQALVPAQPLPSARTPPASPPAPAPELNPRYTFDTFVVGNSNRLAHAAALAVAEAPARTYNPLFIYGGVGLGKTHLLHALGHHSLAKGTSTRITYVSCETFTNDLITAIRERTTNEFRNKYRGADILLVDDIQFMAGKEGTQEEFFHTFNALYEARKQLVISSDRPPQDIPSLEERLRSRFQWGLIADIQPPDIETRVAILRQKAQLEDLDVPNDVLMLIANNFETNVRELEGALTRVVAKTTLAGRPLDVDSVRDALADILPPARRRPVSIDDVIAAVADYYRLPVQDLLAPRRTRALAFPRQVAMYLARELTSASLPRIGEQFGGRDHTTVLHACEKIHDQLQHDPALRNTIADISEVIKNKNRP